MINIMSSLTWLPLHSWTYSKTDPLVRQTNTNQGNDTRSITEDLHKANIALYVLKDG